MTDNYNVVGDIAGNFLTLKALLAKMPQDAELISLGDPNDRGPRSKEVIEFLMTNGRTVNSNHAHMLVEMWRESGNPGAFAPYYDKSVFFNNGGYDTLTSYSEDWLKTSLHLIIPKEHIDWLDNCPMCIESTNFFMSHAPLHPRCTIEEACDIGTGFDRFRIDHNSENCLLWNRVVPEKPHFNLNGKINIFGHNASNEVKIFTEEYPHGIKMTPETFEIFKQSQSYKDYPPYAICLDTSFGKKLTGLHLPTMTLYEQEYID